MPECGGGEFLDKICCCGVVVEVGDQQELDLEPIEDDSVEDDSNDYEAEQELVAEPEVDASEEQPDQEEDLGETEETDEIT